MFKRIISSYTSMAISVIMFVGILNARDINDIRREVIVKFTDNLISLAAGEKSAGKEAITSSGDPRGELLLNSNLIEIKRAFCRDDFTDSISVNEFGDTVIRPRLNDYYKLLFPDSITSRSIYDSLQKLGGFMDLMINGTVKSCVIDPPNDTYFPDQWALRHDTLNGINILGAWEYSTGDSQMVMAVIDPDGVRQDHQDLSPRVFGDITYNGSHGTAVSGVLAANTDNEFIMAGVCPKGRIYSGYIGGTDIERVYYAIIDAVDAGSVVLNNSWENVPQTEYRLPVRRAMAYAYKMNRVVVCSKGNAASWDIHYPSDYGHGIISVGSYNSGGRYSEFSNCGHGIDVVAPGENIISLSATTPVSSSPGWDGTSFSAPHVSGVVALLASYNDSLYNDDIENIIKVSAKDNISEPADSGYDGYTGWGNLNAKAAFDVMQKPNTFTRVEINGGTEYSHTDYTTATFVDVPGLTNGWYYAFRYDVRTWVQFPAEYLDTPRVWGRGTASIGYTPDLVNCGMGYTNVLGNTVSTTGCQLQTFVYHVFTPSGGECGWFPCGVSGVRFAYTSLGEFELLASPYISCWCHYDHQCIRVHFEDPNLYEEGWIIGRKDATSQAWKVIDTIPNNPDPYYCYEDYYPVGGETYTYRVKPFTETQQDVPYSNEETVTARPFYPINLQAYATDCSDSLPAVLGCDAPAPKVVAAKTAGEPPPDPTEDPDQCEESTLGNDITVRWSPASNQKYPIVDYLVKRCVPPGTYGQIWHTWGDTCLYICPNPTQTTYKVYVYAVASSGDTSLPTSRDVCTGSINICPGNIDRHMENQIVPQKDEIVLYQNYPNPFNSTTGIRFSLLSRTNVVIDVYDVLGRKIKTIIDKDCDPGVHSIMWDGRNIAGEEASSGVYFYRINAGNFSDTKKMLILK
jgi:subtilisin family serine protease